MGNFNVIFAASGTGGHLFPALFIADAIKQIKPDSVIHFIGSGRPLEKQILGKSGYKHYKVMAVQIKNQGLLALVVFSLLLPFLLIYCLIIYLRFKPKVVIGVGGYASVVPVLAAYFLRIPIWLHEAEHNPGLANKFLAKFASKISLVHKNTSFKDKDKCILTGYPVRKELLQLRKQKVFNTQVKNLFITGGSLGAESLDLGIIACLKELKDLNLEILHQCSEGQYQSLKEKYIEYGITAEVVRFVDDMLTAYKWADIAISRSGAGVCAELSLINIPSILVPLPQGKEQKENAKNLVDAGKAILVEQGDKFVEELKAAVSELSKMEKHLEMRNSKFTPLSLEAANLIAEKVLQLAN